MIKLFRDYTRTSLFFFTVIALYLALNIVPSIDPVAVSRYNESANKLKLITISIVVPVSIIWSVAFYGYLQVRSYASTLVKAKEGLAFRIITKGLFWLAISMPLRAVLRVVFRIITDRNPDLLPYTTIFYNYTGILFAVIAFVLLKKGAAELLNNTKKRSFMLPQQFWVMSVSLLTACFTYLILVRPVGDTRLFYIPDALIILTIAIPYAYAWYQGALSVYYILQYKRNVPGLLYGQALGLLAAGLSVSVFASIAVQFLIIVSSNLNRLNLTPLLITVYLLLFVIAMSSGLIVKGASKLRKIEEA